VEVLDPFERLARQARGEEGIDVADRRVDVSPRLTAPDFGGSRDERAPEVVVAAFEADQRPIELAIPTRSSAGSFALKGREENGSVGLAPPNLQGLASKPLKCT
jgi:hypothetical protein